MPDLKNQLNQGIKALKEEARDIAIGAGIAEPTILERAQHAAKALVKDAREELGIPSGLGEKAEEFAMSAAEKFGVKEPRVGKSLLGVIKGAFGMLAAISGTAKEQVAASEKFDKACETFSKAMSALFKTKKQEHGKDDKKPAQTPKAKETTARNPARVANVANIRARNEDRKRGNAAGRGGR